MFKLYSNPHSGHSYKVALMLTLTKTPFELENVDLSVPGYERGRDFLSHSFFHEVPVLTSGETTICQSNVILLHLSETLGVLAGESKREKIRVREWLSWESNRIGFSISNLRFQLKFRRSLSREINQFLLSRAVEDLAILESHLEDGEYIVESGLTIADIACCGYLFWLSEAGIDVSEWPAVERWLKKISTQPSWGSPQSLLLS